MHDDCLHTWINRRHETALAPREGRHDRLLRVDLRVSLIDGDIDRRLRLGSCWPLPIVEVGNISIARIFDRRDFDNGIVDALRRDAACNPCSSGHCTGVDFLVNSTRFVPVRAWFRRDTYAAIALGRTERMLDVAEAKLLTGEVVNILDLDLLAWPHCRVANHRETETLAHERLRRIRRTAVGGAPNLFDDRIELRQINGIIQLRGSHLVVFDRGADVESFVDEKKLSIRLSHDSVDAVQDRTLTGFVAQLARRKIIWVICDQGSLVVEVVGQLLLCYCKEVRYGIRK